MSRHQQPLAVASLKGAQKKHPERYRKTPPAVSMVLGNAPDHLSEKAKETWFELAALAPNGVLTGADRVTLEVLANLLTEYRVDPAEYAIGKYAHLIGCLARLGMTPSDRQKLGTEKPPDGNPFETF